MNKVISYDILRTNDYKKMIELVNQAIQDGWQPVGGISIAIERAEIMGKAYYCQALVKYENLSN